MIFNPPPKTKDRILMASLELFNERGSSFITTNHIAQAMGISPGNLYYHYSNKEEIIRAIWLELSAKMDIIWENLVSESPEEDLSEFFLILFRLFYKYRFFWIELSVLLDKDPELSKLYRARVKRILDHYNRVMDIWVEKGMVDRETFERDRKLLLENTWFIGQFWINYSYINKGQVTLEDMKEGLLRVFHLLYPYLMPESAKIIKNKIDKFYQITSEDI